MREFLRRLRKSDVQSRFAEPSSFEKKLQRQRRLTGAWFTFNEVQSIARQSAVQKLIESRDSGCCCRSRRFAGGHQEIRRRGRVYRSGGSTGSDGHFSDIAPAEPCRVA